MTLETYYHRRFPLDLQEAVRRYSHNFGDEDYFHVQDFAERVPSVADGKYRSLFVCLCALGVLMDEVIFTHFSGGYTDFRYLTMFPKVEYGITGTHANPWVLLRGKRGGDGLFENCASVFLQDMRSLLSEVPFPFATWRDVEGILIADKDVSRGQYGELLLHVLKNGLKATERPMRPPRKEDFMHLMSEEEAEEYLSQ
ncbi:hypothetical protein AUJ46_01095 [Candidatus Peregrinibacteria bacterium CG1_02_54_53]|nr:MAG: hypothetical protein AUJ46_01095 [Candidatus Peregrinibacteria bacterium CG1_02_54_53]